jgi:tetratricopeptide (TPR) repeat protein
MAHHDERTLSDEMVRSRVAWLGGDPSDALTHLAVALGLAPLDGGALELLDEVLAATGDGALGALAIEHGTYFGIFALRAYALAGRGRFDEACGLLFDVATFRPSLPYLAWLERWHEQGWAPRRPDGAFVEAFAARVVTYAKAALAASGAALEEGSRRNLEASLAALARLAPGEPPRGRAAFATSFVLRKLGRAAEAAEVARGWFAREPSWASAVEAGAACHVSGDTEGAVRYYGEAVARRPEDVAARLDLGDALLDGGHFEEAARAYREALERAPNHPWAEPSFAYAQYRHTGQAHWREALREMTAREPTRARASALEDRLANAPDPSPA